MRICIFSHQRSGSSVLCDYLAEKYCIENIFEWFDHKVFDEILYDRLHGDDYVVKIMASDFIKDVKFDKIPWHLFDQIIITEREDKTIAMASTYVAEKKYKKINLSHNFEIPNDFFFTWCKILREFFTRKRYILENYKNTKHYYLNDLVKFLKEDNYEKCRYPTINYYERCNNLKFYESKINKLCKMLTNY
jgi:hypothetical protein